MATLERIRNRRSYAFFEELLRVLKSSPTPARVLRWVWPELDLRHSFGSYANAQYALESMEQVLRDDGGMGRAPTHDPHGRGEGDPPGGLRMAISLLVDSPLSWVDRHLKCLLEDEAAPCPSTFGSFGPGSPWAPWEPER